MGAGRLGALRRSLPQGDTLPDEIWRERHRGIMVLLGAHAIAIPIYAMAMGFAVRHIVAESLVVPAALALAAMGGIDRRVRGGAASFGLLSSSAVLVHLSGGVIEMHFHFFVMVAVVALYHDWVPFLAAIAYVLIHHGVLGALDPDSVFNHPAAIAHPWRWAAIHALFVAGISVACLVSWRLQETALAERRSAEERLRKESLIVARLNEVSKTLNAEQDVQGVMQKVTDIATDLTSAAFGAFFNNVEDSGGGSYLLYTLSGAPHSAFASFPMPRNTAIFAPTFEGQAPVRLDDVTADPRYGKSGPYFGMPPGHLAVRSYLAVPVRSARGDVLGGLFFGHPEPGRFSEDDEKIAVGIASHAAVALDNARLHASEKRTLERLSVIAEAGRRLSSSLELDALLQGLAEVIAPAIGDLCIVYLVEGSEIRAVAMHGTDGVPAGFADPRNLPKSVADGGPVAQAIRTGTTQFLPEITEEILENGVSDPQYRALLKECAPSSAIMLPLIGRHEIFGALAIATTARTGRQLTQDDQALAEELARRAAVAVENARLFAAQRTAAITLQHSLLPAQLPDVPGIEAAARYIPGGDGVEVGGDWYDIIELPDGALGLVMGDVVGRGVEAAALMGQLRNGLRAFALEGFTPAEVIAKLNRMLIELGPTDGLATVVYGVYDVDTGTLRVANAGHPPPLVVGIDAQPAFFEDGAGLPLGASARAVYTEAITSIAPGSSVLLYTDGLVEDRTMPLDEGLARLAAASAAVPDLDALCDVVLERCLEGRLVKDDIALLAMRPLPLGTHLRMRLPARTRVLRPLRATLRRWLAAAGVAEDDVHDLVVACGEACTNAVQHPGGSKDFEFEASIEDREIRFRVRDHGAWRAPRPTVGGRGLTIMRALMDTVEIDRSPDGTEVRMRRRLQPAVPGTRAPAALLSPPGKGSSPPRPHRPIPDTNDRWMES